MKICFSAFEKTVYFIRQCEFHRQIFHYLTSYLQVQFYLHHYIFKFNFIRQTIHYLTLILFGKYFNALRHYIFKFNIRLTLFVHRKSFMASLPTSCIYPATEIFDAVKPKFWLYTTIQIAEQVCGKSRTKGKYCTGVLGQTNSKFGVRAHAFAF